MPPEQILMILCSQQFLTQHQPGPVHIQQMDFHYGIDNNHLRLCQVSLEIYLQLQVHKLPILVRSPLNRIDLLNHHLLLSSCYFVSGRGLYQSWKMHDLTF